MARALGLAEHGPHPVADLLHVTLRDRALLLVLDNFEHVVQAASQVAALLDAADRLRIVVTSREPLRLRGTDLRKSLREGKEGNLVVFLVDASGSMGARRRMVTVKTAVLSLLLF